MRIKNSPLTESFLVVPLPEIKFFSPLLKFWRRPCVAGKHAAKRSGTSTTGRDPSLLITTIWKSCPCSVSVDEVAYIKLFLLLFLFLDLEKSLPLSISRQPIGPSSSSSDHLCPAPLRSVPSVPSLLFLLPTNGVKRKKKETSGPRPLLRRR